jgi:ParB/RepB/Spo0J family partition protein
MLPVAAIDANPWHPRRFPRPPDPNDTSLTASIARHGVLMNLLVRPIKAGRYELVYGERRLRCAIAAGLAEVPVIIRDMDDHEAHVLALTGNLQRGDLHFLEEAAAVAGLVNEGWSLTEVAAEVGRPSSWVARRRRLVNLSPTWQKLAESRSGWTAAWGASDYEQVAILEPDAQNDLLATNRHRLERCTSVHELARLIRSLTRPVSGFPWSPDDADLHPVAGPCSACPHRSSQCPGLFDDQERTSEALGPDAMKTRNSHCRQSDRCLDPLCAATKERLYLDRKMAELATRHSRVLLLQRGWLPRDIPGAVRDWTITEVKRGTRNALPAVVAHGPELGRVKWVKLPESLGFCEGAPANAGGSRRCSPIGRKAQLWRRRKIHAIALLKAALPRLSPPPLLTSVRLAIVFGTEQTNASAANAQDPTLPRLPLDMDPSTEPMQLFGCQSEPVPGTSQETRSALGADNAAPSGGVPAANRPFEIPKHTSEQLAGGPASTCHAILLSTSQASPASNPFWRVFDALGEDEAACRELLWARTLRVLLCRMTPNGDVRHVDLAWHEAQRVADLLGFSAQTFLDQATLVIPDSKGSATEKEMAGVATAAGAAAPTR